MVESKDEREPEEKFKKKFRGERFVEKNVRKGKYRGGNNDEVRNCCTIYWFPNGKPIETRDTRPFTESLHF